VAELETVLMGSLGQPIVVKPREAIREAIREGIEQGKFTAEVRGQVISEILPEDLLSDTTLTIAPPVVKEPSAPQNSASHRSDCG